MNKDAGLLAGASAVLRRGLRTRAKGTGADARVFFSIPLAGRNDQPGWEKRCALLGQTLRSIMNQTDADFTVLIAGHERPEIEEMTDKRVKFISCSFEKPQRHPQFGWDKRRKRIENAVHVSKQGGGYIIFLDADDLVSKKLVEYIRYTANPNGYIFHNGYAMDHASRVIAPCFSVWGKTFDQICGSCAAIYFSSEDIGSNRKEAKERYYGQFIQHARWEEVARREGRPLHPISFPAAVYMLNTSQGLSSTIPSGEEILRENLRHIHEHKVRLSANIAKEFSIDPVFPSVVSRILRALLMKVGRPVRRS